MKPQERVIVTSVAYMIGRMFEAERGRHGDLASARDAIARRIGVSATTVHNILRGRLKFVDRIETQARSAFIRMLEQEIARAQHDLEIARIESDRPDTPAIIAAEAAVVAARKAIEKLK